MESFNLDSIFQSLVTEEEQFPTIAWDFDDAVDGIDFPRPGLQASSA